MKVHFIEGAPKVVGPSLMQLNTEILLYVSGTIRVRSSYECIKRRVIHCQTGVRKF